MMRTDRKRNLRPLLNIRSGKIPIEMENSLATTGARKKCRDRAAPPPVPVAELPDQVELDLVGIR